MRRRAKLQKPSTWPHWVWFMIAGAALSPVFTLTPYLRYVGWILTSIIHETGHTLYAWLVGCPALPRLNLAGHAATTHQEQRLLIVGIAWLSLILGAVQAWPSRFWRYPAIAAVIFYPLLAFQPTIRELGHALSGHIGELIVAGIFLWQARTGQLTHDDLDRGAYALVAWNLIFSNAWLAFGIAFVPSVMSWYKANGSYGLVNDYLVAANEILNVNIRTIVLPMLLLSIAIPPLVLFTAGHTRGAND